MEINSLRSLPLQQQRHILFRWLLALWRNHFISRAPLETSKYTQTVYRRNGTYFLLLQTYLAGQQPVVPSERRVFHFVIACPTDSTGFRRAYATRELTRPCEDADTICTLQIESLHN